MRKFIPTIIYTILALAVGVLIFSKSSSTTDQLKVIFLTAVGLIGAGALLVCPKGALGSEIYEKAMHRKPLFIDKLNCYIPVKNMQTMQELLYGYAPYHKAITWISAVSAVAVILLRFVFPATIPLVRLLNIILTIWMVLLTAVLVVSEVIQTYKLCSFFDADKLKPIAILFAPLCNYMLINKMKQYYARERDKIEDTFKEG